MQASELKNLHVRRHYDRVRETTNNLIFMTALNAEQADRNMKFNDQARIAMKWPEHIKSMYDYRKMYGDVYARLFQLCVISLCSDVELFFKATFEKYGYAKGKGSGFFQRLDEVIKRLEAIAFDFSNVQGAIEKIRLAFQVRHIGIHNMGVVDEDFVSKTGVGTVGCAYLIDQDSCREMYDAYIVFLKCIDDKLPSIPA